MRVSSIILIVFLSSCHAGDALEPSYEQCLTVKNECGVRRWLSDDFYSTYDKWTCCNGSENLETEEVVGIGNRMRSTAKRLHEPTGGLPSKLLRTQLVDQCYLSPTCLYLQLQCVYSGMLKKKDGICGDSSWHKRVWKSRMQLRQLPEPLCVQMSQLNELLRQLPLPGLRP
ncbi:hypothetical protein FGIG_04773 [Fasciola gigantica]|uniref:Uncharacterized protein n=1 Tax=Fasciola gigantica TaxID=46835 RepID=A0A504YKE4_FASGI|nr:hypothetical protein FGIG_04773 [Fasciola gigantica]